MQLNNVRIRPDLLALKLSKSNVAHTAATGACFSVVNKNTPTYLLTAKTKQLFLSSSLLNNNSAWVAGSV